MEASKIGKNVEGTDLAGRRPLIKNELLSYRANWHLCLGDLDLALALRQSTDKGVIFRVFDPFHEHSPGSSFDNEFWLNHKPIEIITYLKKHYAEYLNKFVWSVGNNEPGTVGNTQAFVDWCVELAHLGYEHHIRFAIAEIASAKTFWHDEIKNGVWDKLIKTMDVYRGFHIFTVHEYTTGLLPATFLPDYPLNLDNPTLLHTDNWQSALMNLSTIEGNYHLGRGALVTHVRAKQIGIKPLPFVVTECAFDWMADITSNQERAEALGHLENRFRMQQHDFMRGSTGHRLYHEWLMKETDFQGDWNDYLFEQYRWLVNAYPPECEGFTIFALNHDWDEPEGHDMSRHRNDGFRRRVITEPLTKGTIVTKPIPIQEPILGTDYTIGTRWLDSFSETNLRSDRSLNSDEVITITKGSPITVDISSEPLWGGAGYAWYKVMYQAKVWWVASHRHGGGATAVHIRDIEIERPTPEPEPVPDDTPPDFTLPETWQRLEDAVKQYAKEEILKRDARIDALEKALADKQETLHIDIPFPDATYTTTKAALNSDIQFWKMLQQVAGVIVNRLENPTPTMAQVAQEIYGTKAENTVSGDSVSVITSSLLNIKPRGDSLFLEVDSDNDDDDLADAEPLGIAS